MPAYNPDDTSRIVARVRKMLALAADAGATEGERDNALRMAHATLAKYNLDLAAVEASQPAAAATEPRVDHSAEFPGWVWARSVCQSVGELFFCHYVYQKIGKSSKDVRHYFVGKSSNAVTSALVAEFVVQSIAREARRHSPDYASQRAFSLGAAQRIRERVRALKADARQATPSPTPGTALVLASVYATEEEANRRYTLERWSGLRRGSRGRAAYDADAYSRGQAYGSTVSLNAQVR